LIKANRLHVGIVVAELKEDAALPDLWAKAKDQSLGIDNLVLAKYLKLRAEMLAEKDGFLRKT
tara:strand:- start:284 stop:472 length:189 start_codon:yes stop_codon:yes gene_type:complete